MVLDVTRKLTGQDYPPRMGRVALESARLRGELGDEPTDHGWYLVALGREGTPEHGRGLER
jgi:hypothetical protein